MKQDLLEFKFTCSPHILETEFEDTRYNFKSNIWWHAKLEEWVSNIIQLWKWLVGTCRIFRICGRYK